MQDQPDLQAPSDAVTDAWVHLIRAGRDVVRRIEAELKGAGFPPLTWYDVLLELNAAPERQLRMQDLDTRQRFIHWIVYSIRPDTKSFSTGRRNAPPARTRSAASAPSRSSTRSPTRTPIRGGRPPWRKTPYGRWCTPYGPSSLTRTPR